MKTIAVLPLDERPCNYNYINYFNQLSAHKIVLPEKDILGYKKQGADVDGIRKWIKEMAAKTDYMVLSMDMLLYGGIIPSRLHQDSIETLEKRIGVLREIKKTYPKLKIYTYALIMRNPSYSSSDEEPDYYETYGEAIHKKGYLIHKEKLEELTLKEQKELEDLNDLIPIEYWNDYLDRRSVNLEMNKKVVDLLKEDLIEHLVIPQDDSSPMGLTKKDQIEVLEYIEKQELTDKVMIYPGADEVTMSMIGRIHTHISDKELKVFVAYRSTKNKHLIPVYEDRPLEDSLYAQVKAAGCKIVDNLMDCDFVLWVNNPEDKFRDILGDYDSRQSVNTVGFSELRGLLNSGKPVGICDVAFGNGSDMTLLDWIRFEDFVFSPEAYAGWNTSSNTIGTVLGTMVTGLISKNDNQFYNRMKNQWLAFRYIEDGFYQAKIRLDVMQELPKYGLNYFDIGDTKGSISALIHEQLVLECRRYFERSPYQVVIDDCIMPWKRMFEVGIDVRLISRKGVIGLDIGGTKIKGAIVDNDGYYELKNDIETMASGGKAVILKQINLLYKKLKELARERDIDIIGVGIGSAGRVNVETGVVVYATDNLPGWNGLDLGTELKVFIDEPLIIDNDGNVALLGEMWIGSGKGMKTGVMLTIGTGVGGAVYVNGDILRGATYEGAELGHMLLHPNGKQCNCGKKGCVEQYLSGSALMKNANEKGLQVKHGHEIFDLYKLGNKKAHEIVHTFISDFTVTLSIINSFVNPEKIIIGGGVIDSSDIWWDDLEDNFVEANIDRATLGNDAGFIGAAKLYYDHVK